MQWPWSPHRNECEEENMARLRLWYRGLRLFSIFNLVFNFCLTLTSIVYGYYALALIVTLIAWCLHWALTRFLEDVDACAQDVVVYRGKPKFKHRI